MNDWQGPYLNIAGQFFVWLTLQLFQALPVTSQYDSYRFTKLDVRDNLSNNQVTCFINDERGFLWIGTMTGLNRFDGYDFVVFKHDFSDTTSLIDNYIISLFRDHKGRLWVNTRNGFNVYDPVTESFLRDPGMTLQDISLEGQYISSIFEDSSGHYWYLDERAKLFRYDPVKDSCREIEYLPGPVGNITGHDLSSVAEDAGGNLWMITRNGMLLLLDAESLTVRYRNTMLREIYHDRLLEYNLFVDKDDDLWITITNDAQGIYYLNGADRSFRHINSESRPGLNTDIVTGIVQDTQGRLWIATDHGGINLLDKHDFSLQYIMHRPYDDYSLSQNSITALYKDPRGIIWIGTYKQGINMYHPDIVKFNLYHNILNEPASLGYNDVNCFAEDAGGNLWIGTNGGGLEYFNRKTGRFTHYTHDPDDPNSLSNNVIVSLLVDREKRLWIGTFYGGLNLFDGRIFHHYRADPNDPGSISDNRIWEIFQDSGSHIWIGTLGGGLDLYNAGENTFSHYRAGDLNSIHSNFIISMMEDSKGNLWFATADGVDMLDKKNGRFINYKHQENNPASLSNDDVTHIIEDRRGAIWIGTREGLNLFNFNPDHPELGNFRIFTEKDGLADNAVSSILEDNRGNLWIATSNGLSNMIMDTLASDSLRFSFVNYDESDGLQGREFTQKSAFKTSRGELIFGGANGFNLFYPEHLSRNEIPPGIVFTDFQILNTTVGINEKINGRILLKKSITETREITLGHNQNMFSIEFAALNYFQSNKNRYRYKLEGFNDDWIMVDASGRKATYTNLDPGDYIFRVTASNNDGIWNREGILLNIKVLPPLWKSKWAIGAYIFLLIGALLLLRYLILERMRIIFKAQQERREALNRHEIDMLKIKFFTNISHEFKTPLTLIISPIERLLKSTRNPTDRQHLNLIHRNARRLLSLVNQLLDFRRMEVQQFRLKPAEGDIVRFVRDVSYSFSDLAEIKNIDLSFESNRERIPFYFDHDKIEKIVFNLLSNAFKFTQEKGNISVYVNSLEQQDAHTESGSAERDPVQIIVEDTGIGIPPEKQVKIFERFFQEDVPGTKVSQGSGIGLSLVNEFVRLHHGDIHCDSKPNQGSRFTVTLPGLKKSDFEVEPVYDEYPSGEWNGETQLVTMEEPPSRRILHRPTLLLVEDNEDFRFYLKDNLKNAYNIIEAANGGEGWTRARNLMPDLVVSDIMMPVMDGFELCRKIKTDKHTLHIPVILLTARFSDEQKLKGYTMGTDDYITKPFSFEVLESRIRSLIQQRANLKESFREKLDPVPSRVSISSPDEELVDKALNVVEKNISKPEFSVVELSRELGMSRVNLYKKLSSITGKTPIEFIRVIRLRRAAQLLETGRISVSEAAYQVGFNNPKYFSKHFKSEFGVLPSELLQRKNH
jgi:signal transduction histidine kinase/ligand-binding sensor domain-containing protein/DNA-binding response OmpR family regulator